MQKTITLKLTPQEAENEQLVKQLIASSESIPETDVTGFYILKKSIDARQKTIWINLTVLAFIIEPFIQRALTAYNFKDVAHAQKSIIIIGAGPAGLFAALQCLIVGIKPIVIERGKDVRTRRRHLAQLNKTGIVNPESNYCFGEGGAGTYSDGKLYTRSNKRGNVDDILNLFVQFGAAENILYEAHPHIGTNKLPHIITAIRDFILEKGGQVLFNKKLIDFKTVNNQITEVITADGDTLNAHAYILATGHSARDIFELLQKKNLLIEAKPFALGVRIEHPQEIIDSCQYKLPNNQRPHYLPAAAYSLVHQVNGRGVFSFCMCPGGIIAPAATSPNELVVNGWSPSKRNNPYANSGMVVQCNLPDVQAYMKTNTETALNLMNFQKKVEQAAFISGGSNMQAPAQRLIDFTKNITSTNLPNCSYIPGLKSVSLQQVLPPFVHTSLQQGFIAFGKKMRNLNTGFFTNEAVVVATESRTSSPVRIPRNEQYQHPQINNLYPCAEGAGYAGGIISAAIDGMNVVKAISFSLGL